VTIELHDNEKRLNFGTGFSENRQTCSPRSWRADQFWCCKMLTSSNGSVGEIWRSMIGTSPEAKMSLGQNDHQQIKIDGAW